MQGYGMADDGEETCMELRVQPHVIRYGRRQGLVRLTFAAAGSSNTDGLLPILAIGSKPLVMR